MPEILPDLSDVQSSVIPAGTMFEAEIKSATPGVAKSSGNPKITVEFAVNVEGKEFKRTADVPTTGKGAFRFAQLIRAAGFVEYANKLKEAAKTGGAAPAFNTDDLEGQRIGLVFKHEPDQNDPDEVRDAIDKYVRLS